MANLSNSAADPICPTYAAGTISLVTGKGANAGGDFNNDCAMKGQPNGYFNTMVCSTVGSFNSGWENGCWTQTVQPTYSKGLLSFGNTGRQS